VRQVDIAYLRPEQILEERRRCSVVYLPLGPIEWHGPHLPLGTDPIRATEVASRVARAVGGVVMPTFWWGTETLRCDGELKAIGFDRDDRVVGMDFPANSLESMYCDEGIFAVMLREILSILRRRRYRLIVVVSGHGARNHKVAIDRVCAELTDERSRILHLMPMVTARDGWTDWGHATRVETSVMMSLAPETVRLENLPRKGRLKNREWGIVDDRTFRLKPRRDRTVCDEDDPRAASADEGAEDLKQATRRLAGLVRKALVELGK